jgi:hypothetical protein
MRREADVVVAGAGVAASAVACRLIDAGYRPMLLRTPAPSSTGAEILPPDARAQVEALGWGDVFDLAGATAVDGFENHWNPDQPFLKPGPFLHVERTALARSALAFAIRRGAMLQDLQRLPPLGPEVEEGLLLTVDGEDRRFLAAVDATGRAAAWSRPVNRQGRQVAEFFAGPPAPFPMRGRVVSEIGGERWGYRAGLVGSTTVGVVAPGASRRELDPRMASALGVSAESYRFVGRRPSFPQWAAEPALGRRLAVGDAAFASDPLAGQGLLFAMASAIAASAAVDASVRSEYPALALDYYRNFVDSARARHLGTLAGLRDGAASPPSATQVPEILRFTARPRLAALNIDGKLAPEVAYELYDGVLIRWLGGFDLRRLACLADEPIPLRELALKLRAEGLSDAETRFLLYQCINHEILA